MNNYFNLNIIQIALNNYYQNLVKERLELKDYRDSLRSKNRVLNWRILQEMNKVGKRIESLKVEAEKILQDIKKVCRMIISHEYHSPKKLPKI